MIHARMQRQGDHGGIERCRRLAGISRARYYRHVRACAPRQEETALRDEIQRLSLATRSYGYWRITAQLRQLGFAVNHKRVARLRPATTDSRHRFSRIKARISSADLVHRKREGLPRRWHYSSGLADVGGVSQRADARFAAS